MKIFKVSLFFLFLLVMSSFLSAQDNLVEMTDFYPEEIQMAGFTLSTDQTVSIETASISHRRNHHEFSFSDAWILNAGSRDLVWELSEADPEDRSRYLSTFETEIELGPGTYEVYYSTYPHFNFEDDFNFHWGSKGYFSGIFNELLSDDDDDETEKYKFFDDLYDQLYLKVNGTGTKLTEDEIQQRQIEFKEKSFISFTQLRDDEFEEQIFKVSKPIELQVYALGEARRDGEYDFGVIINLKTRERVWELSYRKSGHAGGNNKNRFTRDTVNLEPGIYKALYVTDDSHSFRRWNTAPPFDPSFWGMTLWVEGDGEQSALVKLEPDDTDIIARLVRVRDDKRKKVSFSVVEDAHFHVYAIGEGSDGEMYDYAWIENKNTGRVVWEMTYRKTDRAGGARKNRVFDDRVYLEAGEYIVYYETDDSHSFNDWNAGPPEDPFNWGVTISKL